MAKIYRKFVTLLDDFLKDQQFAADFLSESLLEEDLDVFLLSLKDVIRVHGNLGAVAKKANISRGTLYKLFSVDANPEIKTLLSVLDSLGYALKVTRKERKINRGKRFSARRSRRRFKSLA